MSERWKPKEDEYYWFVNETAIVQKFVWTDDKMDREFHETGNCFKTKAEAEAAAEKVKALLLSLHDNDESTQENIQDMVTNTCKAMDKGKENVAKATCTFGNLPKLTAEVFDRPDCPEWAQYAAVVSNGNGVYLSSTPYPGDISGFWHVGKWDFIRDETQSAIKWDASNWKNSLIERPAKENKLPEIRCEVGTILWHKRCGYFKVTYIDDYSKCIDIQQVEDKSKGYLSFHTVCNEVKPARLRPYNAEEMKALVGRTVAPDYRAVFLVTKFVDTSEGGEVCIDSIYYNADRLLDEFTIAGKPAGVLEHLENGEWVE